MPTHTVAVIIATLDEAANIGHVLDTALGNEAVTEVIVADGGSTDGTREAVAARASGDARVRLVDNPFRIQSGGLNLAASTATADLLLRLDAHTTYSHDYIERSVAVWRPGTAVGGPMRADGDGPWAEAIAYAMDDPMAVGPARFRHATAPEDVDTVYLGLFERMRFLAVGGYRTFPSGTVEDTDFYARWRADGGTVRVDPSIRSSYHPRARWGALWRQYRRYGQGKAELFWLNGRLPSVRALAPAALIAGLVGGTAFAIVVTPLPIAALLLAWGAALVTTAARAPARRVRTAVTAATMHAAYGAGTWIGVLRGRPSVQTLGLSDSVADR
jgi:succinoglycan biosynthesis protein ExoA